MSKHSDSSSEDEDLSRFRDVVDNSFLDLISSKHDNTKNSSVSERFIVSTGHYNDLQVNQEVQRKIGAKISAIIENNVKFVDIQHKKIRSKVKGGVKLFSSSADFLTCEQVDDTQTLQHNEKCKKLEKKRRLLAGDTEIDDNEKIKTVVVDGEHVLSKKETKHWKSRRKEKVFKYKATKNNVLTAIE